MEKALKDMAISLAKNETKNYSYEEVHESFRKEVAKLVCDDKGKIDYYKWESNKKHIFALIGTMIDEILPPRVNDALGRFATIKTFGDGDKPRFYLKKGRMNVKRFVTRVAAAGRYERVRLDRDYLDMEMYAHGGAVFQTLEGFLSGREQISEVFEILLEGLEDEMYRDITTALQGTFNTLPAKNTATHAGFDAAKFDKVLATVKVYGTATIFCTPEFAHTIDLDANFIGDADKNDMRNQGYIGKYKGAAVVVIPQSFVDETNEETVIDPQYAYIMPSGANADNPVLVGLEGPAKVREMEREDWSTEIQTYKKMGIAIMNTNHFGIYQNTSLA